MGMSGAERQRKFRLLRDSDPERRREYLQKCMDKYTVDKQVGKKKLVKDMTGRERRHAKKIWRKRKRNAREKKKILEETIITPPATPPNSNRQHSEQSQKKRGKIVAKCFRDNKVKDREIKLLKKKMLLYKKHWIREKAKSQHKESPRTKTRALLRNFSVKTIRKTLFTYNVLIQQLREKYNGETKKGKLRLAKNISGSILKKYKVKMITFRSIGIAVSRKKKGERNCLSKRICEKVKAFYLRQDNSRVITGLKKTVTKGKEKKQRRLLCDNLINLHLKFLTDPGIRSS